MRDTYLKLCIRTKDRGKSFCAKSLLMLFCYFMLATAMHAQQQVTVKGNVTDEAGAAIIGAAIKCGSTGTVSDIDGNFSLNVPSNATIQVTFLGYLQQTVKVEGKTSLFIVLKEDAQSLDEVVVVGYGSQRIKDVTGSIVPVDMAKISDLPVSSLTEALQGHIPGLSIIPGTGRPGDNPTLGIRQQVNMSKDGGNSLPLIVIDDVIQVDASANGQPTLEQFNMLDPSEIESITVLKDASAAIYGSRASQGAIIVKTKRGKEGTPQISYSGKFEIKDAVGHTKTMSAHEYGIFSNRFLRATGATEPNKFFSDSELEEMKSLNYNWLDKAWSSAFTMSHSLNVSGGSKKATYFAGVTYYDQGANLGDQDYNKWTFRVGTDIKLSSYFKISASLSGNNGRQEKSYTKVGNINDSSYGSRLGGENVDYGIMAHMPKYIPWSQNIDGQEYWVSPALGPSQIANNANVANQMAAFNYFAWMKNGSKSINETFSYNANFSLQYDLPFIPGLSIKASYARSHGAVKSEQTQLPFTLALARGTNTEGGHLYSSVKDWIIAENDKNSRVLYTDDISKNEQLNLYLDYNAKFGLHTIGAMVSVERAESEYTTRRLYYESPIPGGYIGGSSSAGTLIKDHSYSKFSERGALSYLGRVNYNYDGKYLAQFLFRADASTKFAPENYWGFFPTLSLGWVISEENWFKENINWLDYLKIRASVGKTGKDNVAAWRWLQLYGFTADKGMQFGNNGGTYGSALEPRGTPNRDVHWDKTLKYNLGLDFNFLKNRLHVGWDAYFDRSTDVLISLAGMEGVPIHVGGGFAEENYGAFDNWGTEFNINWRDKVGEVSYNIGVNFSIDNNKVKKYPEAGIGYPSDNATRVGHSSIFPEWGLLTWKGTSSGDGMLRTDGDIDAYWNYLTELATAAGTTPLFFGGDKSQLKKGMLVYQDLHGDLNTEDGTLAGPNGRIVEKEDYTKLVDKKKKHGFTTNLAASWRGISFSTQIATSWGGYESIDYINQLDRSNNMLWSHASYMTDMYDETENVNGKYPNVAHYRYNQYKSDFWKVSTFRCYIRSMSIGYAIPRHLIKRIGIESAKLNLSGHNLWDFHNPYPNKYRNMYDNAAVGYPTLRTWALGVNLTF